MAQKFVLTAELQFRKSADIDRFVSEVKRKFSDVNIKVNTSGAREAIRDMNNLRNTTERTRDSTEALARTFALSFKRFVSFSVATRFVSVFTSRLDAAFRKAREFEAEMIKVSQVTGKSVSQLSDLTNEINRLATGYGVYSNTLAKVSVLLSQAGFTARDTRIALDTLAKTELSPTFDNIISTTEGAIAIFNQFGLGADALSAQLGSLNKIAGAFAVESGDLIEVVRRVGGVFKSSGGNLNELMSLFTSVRQTTRESAESIATALRTIFVRIQRPKTIEYLRKFGVEITDAAGRFVGPLEAIEKIYEKFGNLPQGDLRLIEAGEVLAGFRQIGKFIPLIQQYKITQEALNVAKAGENSLDQDAIKAKEGLSNKLSRLNEEFLLLIRNISESKSFKVITDFFISTTSAVIKLVDALKPLIPLFTAFAGIRLAKGIGGFSRNFKDELGQARTLAFNTGGGVPGYGNGDTVPALLTPGEFVINKRAAKTIGANKLHQMNKSPQRLNDGGYVKDLTSNKKTLENYYDTEEDFDLYKKIDVNHIILNKKRDRYRNHAKKIWEEASKKEDLSSANKYIIKKTGGFSQNLGEKELDPKEDSENRLNKIAGALAEKDVNNILKGSEKLVNKAGADFKIKKNHFAEVKTNKYKVSDNEIKAKALLGYGYDKKFLNNQKDEIPKIVIDFYHPQFLNKGGFVVEDGSIGVISAANYNKSNAIDKTNEIYRFPSTISSKDGGIKVAPFGMSVYTLSAKKELLDLASKKASEGIKELSKAYGVEDSVSESFSKSSDVTSSFAGYLNEGLISLLTGMQRTGGDSSFDFDLFSNDSNFSAAQKTFPEIFGRNILPNTKLIDAKLSAEADTLNKIKEKVLDFIKNMGFNPKKSMEENREALNLLSAYGFKYDPTLEKENLGIKHVGKRSFNEVAIAQELLEKGLATETKTSQAKSAQSLYSFGSKENPILSNLPKSYFNDIIKIAAGFEAKKKDSTNVTRSRMYSKLGISEDGEEIAAIRKMFIDNNIDNMGTRVLSSKRRSAKSLDILKDYADSPVGAIGFFDTDLMREADVKNPNKIRSALLSKAISLGIPITEIMGAAGSGKTTLAKQIAKGKGKGLYPIFKEEDLNGLDSIINIDAEISHSKLKSYLAKLSEKDEVLFLSSTTDKEMAALTQNRIKRDITGENLFGREKGSTLNAPKNTGLSEAIAQQYIKAPIKFISVAGGKEKSPIDYDFLSGDKGRLGADSVGGFSPTTIGHVQGLTQDILKKGVKHSDYLIRVSSGDVPSSKEKQEKTLRSGIFGKEYGFYLAKLGFGDAGFDNVVRAKSFNPELGFIDKVTGRPKVFDIELDPNKTRKGKTIVATGGKAQEGNYVSAKNAEALGYDNYDSKRSSNSLSEISGTEVRKYISSGEIDKLEDYLTPSVYDSILKNKEALKNRSQDISKIVAELEKRFSGEKLKNALEEEFKKDEKYKLKFAGGGPVPGVGNRDTVPAMLTPGEYVLNKSATASIGMDTLNKLNKGTKQGKHKGSYYFNTTAKPTESTGGFSIPGGALGALAGVSVLASTLSQVVGEGTAFAKVLQQLQFAGIKAAGSYYLMSQAVSRISDVFEKDLEGNIAGGLSNIFKKNKGSVEFDKQLEKLAENFKGFQRALNDAELELEAAKLTKDKVAIEEKTKAVNDAERNVITNKVISDPKKIKERIERDKSLIKNGELQLKKIDNVISTIENNIKEALKKNPQEDVLDAREKLKEIYSKRDRVQSNIEGVKERINMDEGLLDLQPKSIRETLKNYTKDLNFKTAAGRGKIAGLAAGAGSVISSGFDSVGTFFSERADSQLKKGNFSDARSSLEFSNELQNASSVTNFASQGAALGAAFGPVGLAAGAAAGSLYGLYDVINSHSDKINAINFKIFEESLAVIQKKTEQFKAGETGVESLKDGEAEKENAKSSIELTQNTIREAARRKSGIFGRFADRASQFAGDNTNTWTGLALASATLGGTYGLGKLDQAKNNKNNFLTEDVALSNAILSKDINQEERSQLIERQKVGRQTKLNELKAIAENKTLTIQQKRAAFNDSQGVIKKDVEQSRDFSSKEEKRLEDLIKKEERLGKNANQETLKTLRAEESLAEARRKMATITLLEIDSISKSIDAVNELIQVNSKKVALESLSKGVTMDLNRILKEGKDGVNLFARAVEESEFFSSGQIGRSSQLASANNQAFESLKRSGLNKEVLAAIEKSLLSQNSISKFFDDVSTGVFTPNFDEANGQGVGAQFIDQYGEGIQNSSIAGELENIITKIASESNNDPKKLAEELKNSSELKKIRESLSSEANEINKIQAERLDKIKSVNTERINAEQQYINEINNIINLRKESEQLVAEFGGKSFTPERNRQLELERYNKSTFNKLQSLDGNSLKKQAEILNKRAIKQSKADRNDPNFSYNQEVLKSDTEAFIALSKANIDIRRKEIEIIKEKNRLENDALKSLANGDIESYFNNLQASVAQNALSYGDNTALNQLSPRAISLAVENLQSMQSSGITEYNGRNINELIREGNIATANSLGNTVLARRYAYQNTETSIAQLDARRSAEALSSVTQSQELTATDTFKNSVQIFEESVKYLDKKISGGINSIYGGVQYRASGGSIFKPKGTDTIPAMLTPGEFVVNRKAAKNNLSLLRSINDTGKPAYANYGGLITFNGKAVYEKGFRNSEFRSLDNAFKNHINNFLSLYQDLENAEIITKENPLVKVLSFVDDFEPTSFNSILKDTGGQNITYRGFANIKNGTISVNTKIDDIFRTIKHELAHFIDNSDAFRKISDTEAYKNIISKWLNNPNNLDKIKAYKDNHIIREAFARSFEEESDKAYTKGLKNLVNQDVLKNNKSRLKEGFINSISAAKNSVRNVGSGILNAGKGVGSGIFSTGKNVGSGILNAGKGVGSGILDSGKNVGSEILDSGKNFAKSTLKISKAASPGIIAKLASQKLGASEEVSDAASLLSTYLYEYFNAKKMKIPVDKLGLAKGGLGINAAIDAIFTMGEIIYDPKDYANRKIKELDNFKSDNPVASSIKGGFKGLTRPVDTLIGTGVNIADTTRSAIVSSVRTSRTGNRVFRGFNETTGTESFTGLESQYKNKLRENGGVNYDALNKPANEIGKNEKESYLNSINEYRKYLKAKNPFHYKSKDNLIIKEIEFLDARSDILSGKRKPLTEVKEDFKTTIKEYGDKTYRINQDVEDRRKILESRGEQLSNFVSLKGTGIKDFSELSINQLFDVAKEISGKEAKSLSEANTIIDNYFKNRESKTSSQSLNKGGIVYANRGRFINFQPKGSDTVPAMLTPGEFVLRKSAVDKIGVRNLNKLNTGYYNKGGAVGGSSEVYNQAGFEQFGVAVQMFKESVSIFKDAISIGSDVQALSNEISKLRESFSEFASTNMSVQLNPTSVQVNISDMTNSMRQGLSESAQQAIIDRVVEELKRGRY